MFIALKIFITAKSIVVFDFMLRKFTTLRRRRKADHKYENTVKGRSYAGYCDTWLGDVVLFYRYMPERDGYVHAQCIQISRRLSGGRRACFLTAQTCQYSNAEIFSLYRHSSRDRVHRRDIRRQVHEPFKRRVSMCSCRRIHSGTCFFL